MSILKRLKIGTDPEVFLQDANGKIISSIGIIGGDKSTGMPMDKEGFSMLEDNVACEFNIPPAEHEQDFSDNIQYALDYITKILPEGLSISTKASAIVDPDQLEHPKAMEFGCEPDFNSWTNEVNPRPIAEPWNMRACG